VVATLTRHLPYRFLPAASQPTARVQEDLAAMQGTLMTTAPAAPEAGLKSLVPRCSPNRLPDCVRIAAATDESTSPSRQATSALGRNL
jgi:hypothetical protein